MNLKSIGSLSILELLIKLAKESENKEAEEFLKKCKNLEFLK